MARYELFREHAKAMASGQGIKAKELQSQIASDEHEAHFMFIGALFAGVTTKHFGDDLDRADLQPFVAGVLSDFRKASPPLKALSVEGMIRGAYGEDRFFDEIPVKEQVLVMWAVIRKLVDQTPEIKDNLDSYLADAETLGRSWLNA